MNSHYKRRRVNVFFSVLLLILLCDGCSRSSFNTEGLGQETTLTGIFTLTSIPLEEGMIFEPDTVPPDYNAETGEIRLLVTTSSTGDSSEQLLELCVVTVRTDGSDDSVKKYPLKSVLGENRNIVRGVFDGDRLVCVTAKSFVENGLYSTQWNLMDFDLSSGIAKYSDPLDNLFTGSFPYLNIGCEAVDGDGNVYVTSGNEILVLDRNFIRVGNLSVSGSVLDLARDREGQIWSWHYDTQGRKYTASHIDPNNGASVTEEIASDHGGARLFMPEGFDFCFADNTGIRGVLNGDEEVLFSYYNSGLSVRNMKILAMSDAETVFVCNGTENGALRVSVARRAPDVCLENAVTLRFVVLDWDTNLQDNLIGFRQIRPDIAVELLDYSEWTPENLNAGAERFLLDLGAGVVSPDIVLTHTPGGSNSVWDVLSEGDHLADLNVLLPEEVKEDIFACVVRSLTVNGKLTSLCRSFSVPVHIGHPDALKQYEFGWTLEEALSYEEAQTKKTEIGLSSKVSYMNDPLFASVVNRTYRNGDFTSELFVQYLDLIGSYSDFSLTYSPNYMDTLRAAQTDGSIADTLYSLSGASDWAQLELVWNRDDFVILREPDSDWYGNVNANLYAVMKTSGNPGLCAELIEWITRADQGYVGQSIYGEGSFENGIPSSRSAAREIFLEESGKYDYILRQGGFFMEKIGRNEKEIPGTKRVRLSTEQIDRFVQYLDSVAGMPLEEETPEKVEEIVAEEISAYLSGIRNAEECAKKIQSRVSIWMAEHS